MLITIVIFIFILTVIATIIAEIKVRYHTYVGKKRILLTTANESLHQMLIKNKNDVCLGNTKILVSNIYSYHPLKGTIHIRGFNFKTVFDHILALHEGGHCLSINQSKQYRERFLLSLIVITLNRILVIPMFIFICLLFFNQEEHNLINPLFLTFLFSFFVVASILRLSIGMIEEYQASKLALEYINLHYENIVIVFAKKLLKASFYQQLTQSIIIFLSVSLIYSIILSEII